MATLTERWADVLSDAQRTAWNLYASSVSMLNKLGESIHLSGFNHYIRSNTWRLDLGQTIVDAGPIVFTIPDQDPLLSIAASEATQLITITFDDTLPWCTEDDAGIMILEGSPQNNQRNFFGGPYKGRSAKMGADPGGIASPQTYTAIHTISEGQRIWGKYRIIRADGRLSNPFTAQCVIAA